ncbi:MAG: Hsp20/alpha crystallin family protein [Mycobacterium sp.]
MSSLALWSRPIDTDRWVRDFFNPTTVGGRHLPTPNGFNPAVEITRDGDDAVVRLELPGVDVDRDVTVELDGGHLIIRGERRDEHADTDEHRTVREMRYGAFNRSFAVPARVTGDAVSASYDAGVLTVRVADVYAGTQSHRVAITK